MYANYNKLFFFFLELFSFFLVIYGLVVADEKHVMVYDFYYRGLIR